MRKLIPMTVVALCAFAAPAFAQDGDVPPGLEGLKDRVDEFMKKIDEIIQPLIQKLEETLQKLSEELESWMDELDPGDMFGEFDMEQWIEELKRMMPPMPGGDEDEDEDFMFLPPVPITA